MSNPTEFSAERNQLFPNKRWLVCRPHFFDVRYEINPWMSVQRAPHSLRAAEQWNELHHTLIRLGAWLEYVEPHPSQPDMVFTANAGLVKGSRFICAKFRFVERQGEEPHYLSWFEKAGYEVLRVPDGVGSFEGEGDALFGGEKLFCGYGFRSDRAAFDEVAKALGVNHLVACRLVDPRFYHLDTCFTVLNERQAMFFPGAFSVESQRRLEDEIELFPVPLGDAQKFACNAVVLGKDIVLPAGCAETEAMLRRLGYTPYPVELGEFLKAGGAAKCLSMRI